MGDTMDECKLTQVMDFVEICYQRVEIDVSDVDWKELLRKHIKRHNERLKIGMGNNNKKKYSM